MSSSSSPKRKLRVSVLRVVVGGGLILAAALMGYAAYYFLLKNQNSLEEKHYNAMADKMQDLLLQTMTKQWDAMAITATAFAFTYPNASAWPFVAFPIGQFDETYSPLALIVSISTALLFAPIVTPAQVPEFEAFAEKWIADSGYRSQYPTMGISPFGKGIFSVNATTGQRYHSTTAWSGGKRDILLPRLNVATLVNSPTILYNAYTDTLRADAIDYVLDCAMVASGSAENCTTITDVIIGINQYQLHIPAAIMLLPIKLPDGSVVGTIGSGLNWMTELTVAVDPEVSVFVVVQFGTASHHSFVVQDGVVTYLGEGDLHDTKRDQRRYSFVATEYGPEDRRYRLHLYPTDHWVRRFHNSQPAVLCGVTVGILTVIALLFFFYDFLMSRASREQDLVLLTKQQFVRYISHEIRTPTNIVQLGFKLLYSEMFALRATLTVDSALVPGCAAMLERFEDWLGLVLDVATSADGAISVLNDLINYDKLHMGKLQLELEPLFVWDVLGPAIQPFVVQARHAGVRLDVDREDERASVSAEDKRQMRSLVLQGDGTKIGQVIRNLVCNALKFTPCGGAVLVTAEWMRDGMPGVVAAAMYSGVPRARAGSLVVSVQDHGAGMSAEEQRALFQEGVQFHANKLQAGGGSGLGLWISKGIVEMHHGTLTAHSEGVGQGSVFRLELPLVLPNAVEEAPMAEYGAASVPPSTVLGPSIALAALGESPVSESVDKEAGTIPGVAAPQRVRNVLVTDDSAPSRKMVGRLLRLAGYTCFEAGDGQECVDKVLQARDGAHPPIDVVLMDFEMPRMSGPTATGVLRSLGCGVAVIGITGNVLLEDREIFLSKGALKVLAKPFSPPELLALLESEDVPRRPGDPSSPPLGVSVIN